MKPLAIDFGQHGLSMARRAGIGFLVLAIAGAGTVGWQYGLLRSEQGRWQSDWQKLNGMAMEVRESDTPEQRERLQAELRFANRVIDQLDTPWDALFGAVENAYSDQAILLGVEPDTERREVRLTAEAKNLGAMLEYLKQVRQSPVLKDAYLASHQINQQDPQRPVRFVIEARWVDVPATSAPPAATVTLATPDTRVVQP